MDPRQLFGVWVRIIGVLVLVYGFYASAHILMEIAGVETRIHEPHLAGIILSAVWVGAGLFLLLAADAIVRVAYRNQRN
jgi:hypothetical protein